MDRLLIAVDMQNDFINGSLGTKEAEQIVDKVKSKIKSYISNGDRVIFTMDTHSENYLETQEGKNLPVVHCIKGTTGWQLHPDLSDLVTADTKIYEKVTFGSSELAQDILKGSYRTITQVELIGICTDICVITNALLVKTLLPEIPVIVDSSCCAGVTKESHQTALDAMKMCQIIIQ